MSSPSCMPQVKDYKNYVKREIENQSRLRHPLIIFIQEVGMALPNLRTLVLPETIVALPRVSAVLQAAGLVAGVPDTHPPGHCDVLLLVGGPVHLHHAPRAPRPPGRAAGALDFPAAHHWPGLLS